MVFKLRVHWAIRLSVNLIVINSPVIAFWYYPYLFWNYKIGDRKVARRKNYSQVRMKTAENIAVMTTQAELALDEITRGNHPLPLYSNFPTDEEIRKLGLMVIGKTIDN